MALRADNGAVVTDSQNMARILANYYAFVYRTDEGRDHLSLPETSTIIIAPHFTSAAVRTPILCNIFEKLLKKALLLFLTKARSFSPSQHGFLPRRSCLSNLILQEDRVTRLLDEVHTVDLVFLDFAKAFDSINHRFLLAKLKSFGIDRAVLNWIKSYCQIDHTRSKSTASFLRRLPVIVASPKVQALAHYFVCYI